MGRPRQMQGEDRQWRSLSWGEVVLGRTSVQNRPGPRVDSSMLYDEAQAQRPVVKELVKVNRF